MYECGVVLAASSKWIQVSISDLENGYTGIKIPIFDFGPWSFCSYSLVTCNNSNNCEITKCRAVKEADLSDFFHSCKLFFTAVFLYYRSL